MIEEVERSRLMVLFLYSGQLRRGGAEALVVVVFDITWTWCVEEKKYVCWIFSSPLQILLGLAFEPIVLLFVPLFCLCYHLLNPHLLLLFLA